MTTGGNHQLFTSTYSGYMLRPDVHPDADTASSTVLQAGFALVTHPRRLPLQLRRVRLWAAAGGLLYLWCFVEVSSGVLLSPLACIVMFLCTRQDFYFHRLHFAGVIPTLKEAELANAMHDPPSLY
jgi:hypothetical protein